MMSPKKRKKWNNGVVASTAVNDHVQQQQHSRTFHTRTKQARDGPFVMV